MKTENEDLHSPPIIARRLYPPQAEKPLTHRVIRLETWGMVIDTGDTFFASGVQLDFEITLFGTLTFYTSAKAATKEKDKAGERTWRFVKIDEPSKLLLEQTFQRFSHLKHKELETITYTPGAAVRKRVPCKLPATLLIGEVLVSGLIENISEGGAFFACDHLLPLGAEGMLRFEMNPKDPLHNLQAKTVWHWQEIKHGLRSFSAGAGMQFIGGTSESIKGVKDFVQDKLAEEDKEKA